MIQFNHADITQSREQLLTDACQDFAQSLLKIDPANYFLFFRLGEMPAVYEKVGDIIDQHFAIGTVAFACTGDIEMGWNEAPSLGVDLEFLSKGIFAFFRLNISQKYTSVEIHHIVFQESAENPEKNTEAFRLALQHSANNPTSFHNQSL